MRTTLREFQISCSALPRPARGAVIFCSVLPFLLALQIAFGDRIRAGDLVTPLGVVLVMEVFTRRDVVKLDGESRRAVSWVVRSGVSSGSAVVDGVAAQRLKRASGSPVWLGPVMLAIIMLMLVVVPVVAAYRGSAWWLLSLITLAFVAITTPLELFLSDPRVRLARLSETSAQDPA